MHQCWRIGMLCKTGITVVLGMGVPSCPTPHMSLVRTWLQVFPRVLFSSSLTSRPYGWLVQQKVLSTLGSFLDLLTILNFGPIDNMPKLSSNEISNTSFFFFLKGLWSCTYPSLLCRFAECGYRAPEGLHGFLKWTVFLAIFISRITRM